MVISVRYLTLSRESTLFMTTFINAHAETGQILGIAPLTLGGPAYSAALCSDVSFRAERELVQLAHTDDEAVDSVVQAAESARKLYEDDRRVAGELYGRLGAMTLKEDGSNAIQYHSARKLADEAAASMVSHAADNLEHFRAANILIAAGLLAKAAGEETQSNAFNRWKLEAAAESLITPRVERLRTARDAYCSQQRGLPLA